MRQLVCGLLLLSKGAKTLRDRMDSVYVGWVGACQTKSCPRMVREAVEPLQPCFERCVSCTLLDTGSGAAANRADWAVTVRERTLNILERDVVLLMQLLSSLNCNSGSSCMAALGAFSSSCT